jgi:hypothetical protein
MEARHLELDQDQDQVRLPPQSCAAERAVTLLPAAQLKEPLRRTHPIQAVPGLCPILHPWATPVPQVRNRPQLQREGTRSLVRPIK